MNWKTIQSYFKIKEVIFIFILFLFFFPVKTQVHNVLGFCFDYLFMEGKISEIFTYNYTGDLVGCTETMLLDEVTKTTSFPWKNMYILVRFILSIIFFGLLYYSSGKMENLKQKHWWFLFVFSFFLFDSIERMYYVLGYYPLELIKNDMLIISMHIITLFMAAYVFFKILRKKEKVQLCCIAFPASFLSINIWFLYFGPKLLPIIKLPLE